MLASKRPLPDEEEQAQSGGGKKLREGVAESDGYNGALTSWLAENERTGYTPTLQRIQTTHPGILQDVSLDDLKALLLTLKPSTDTVTLAALLAQFKSFVEHNFMHRARGSQMRLVLLCGQIVEELQGIDQTKFEFVHNAHDSHSHSDDEHDHGALPQD